MGAARASKRQVQVSARSRTAEASARVCMVSGRNIQLTNTHNRTRYINVEHHFSTKNQITQPRSHRSTPTHQSPQLSRHRRSRYPRSPCRSCELSSWKQAAKAPARGTRPGPLRVEAAVGESARQAACAHEQRPLCLRVQSQEERQRSHIDGAVCCQAWIARPRAAL